MARQIRALPIAPSSERPATFNAEADAFVAALSEFVSDANALANEAEALSQNATSKSDNVDEKYEVLATKYGDFIAKYQDFFTKFDLFVPKYNDTVTKHGEVSALSEHVDSQKQLIDEALERAKSFINEQNNVINDTKISEVSTLSSKRLKELIDLKADEATAYKDWNYKTISTAYTAKDNDALFVEATAPFEITLPAKGKVRIIDKAGNFATHNIKLVAGSDKFVLNKDFQRVELFFFNGKWQVVGGYLLVEKSGYSVSKISKNKSQLLGSKAVDRCFVKDNLMIAYHKSSAVGYGNNAVVAIDLNTMTDIMPALPSVPSGMYFYAVEASNELFLFAWKEDTKEVRLFKFNRSTKNWQQISSSSIQSLINSSAFNSYTHANLIYDVDRNKNLYIRFYKNASGVYYNRVMKISPTGTATDCGEISSFSPSQYFKIIDDILFITISNSGSYQITECKNLRNTPAPINELKNKTIENNTFYTDFKLGKFFARQRQQYYPNKVIEWEFEGIPQEITKNPSELPTNGHIYYEAINFTKQNTQIKKESHNSISLEYDFYQNNRPTRKKEVISSFYPSLDKATPDYTNGNKEYFVEKTQMSVLEVTFTPTTFQEEI